MTYAFRASFRFAFASVAALGALTLGACSNLSIDGNSIDYTMEPQEFAHNFGDPQPATFLAVTCAADADCQGNQAIQSMLPSGASTSCDTSAGQCVATFDVQLFQTINLSQQKSLPTVVLNSPIISVVQVGAVHYWTPTNTLKVTSPEIGLYVGPNSAQKVSDAGVVKLGTLPSLKVNDKTACSSAAPGTQASACDVPLTEAGKNALGVFAKEIKQPFNLLIEAPLTVKGGEAFPGGNIDIFLQPVLSFVL